MVHKGYKTSTSHYTLISWVVSIEAASASFTPFRPLCQCSVSRIFKAIVTRIRRKSKQTLKSPRIELWTRCSESRALANWATHAIFGFFLFCFCFVFFEERGENRSTRGKNLSEQSRKPTNSTHIWRRIQESIPGHIGGRRVLSPLCQPCSPVVDRSFWIDSHTVLHMNLI